MSLRRALCWSVGLALVLTPLEARANLFDFLFGSPEPEQPVYRPPPSIGIKVNPRRKIRREERKAKGKERSVPKMREARRPAMPEVAQPNASESPKGLRQVSIDPVKNPDWHLKDPNLERGDIVVLKSGVFVFEGTRGRATKDAFTSLVNSKLVSKQERERILQMAQPGSSETASAEPPPQRSTALKPAGQQVAARQAEVERR